MDDRGYQVKANWDAMGVSGMDSSDTKQKLPALAGQAVSTNGGWSGDRLTLSVEEAGRVLGISRGAAYARAGDGSLPTVRLGKRLLVPTTALKKLLQID
jgi:excisionase family DNA binding protein